MLRNQTLSPWSWIAIRPLRTVPYRGMSLNLLPATRFYQSSLPHSYSTTFSPLSQCST